MDYSYQFVCKLHKALYFGGTVWKNRYLSNCGQGGNKMDLLHNCLDFTAVNTHMHFLPHFRGSPGRDNSRWHGGLYHPLIHLSASPRSNLLPAAQRQ